MPIRQSTAPRTAPPLWTPPPTGTRFMTGAKLTPKPKVLAAHPFTGTVAPAQFAIVPGKLSYWGNNQYGICVTSEEAFAKACHTPEIFLEDSVVIAWARQRGFLNGADLKEVCDAMLHDGIKENSQLYNDGPALGVDYSNESVLQSAIAQGNVKIAMASGSLPSGAGNQQGWFAFGSKGRHSSDHCTGLSGYGTAGYCFQQLGVPIPSGVDPNKPNCYLHFTWSTIGVVDHEWLMSTCEEAWVRNPTTVGVPPIPDPVVPPLNWVP